MDCLQLLKMPKLFEQLVKTYIFGLFYRFGELAFRSVNMWQTQANQGPDSTFVFEANLKCLVPNASRTSNVINNI